MFRTETVIPPKIGLQTHRVVHNDANQNESSLKMNLDLLEETRDHVETHLTAKAKKKSKV